MYRVKVLGMGDNAEEESGLQNWSIEQRLSPADMNQLVMDYLITEGYKEAAEKFKEEAGLDFSLDDYAENLEKRIDIRKAVHDGKIEKAVEMINDLLPELLDNCPYLHFHLLQQELIEMIRDGRVDDALSFAQEQLAEKGEADAKVLEEIEKTLALLAFEKPEQCPFGYLLDVSHRDRVASEVNAAILEAECKNSCPRLEVLVKMVYWSQNLLDKKRVQYPKLVDVGEGKIQEAKKKTHEGLESDDKTAIAVEKILDFYFSELTKLLQSEKPLKAISEEQNNAGASEEVQELRVQLRQLTDELHSLRNNLRNAPEMMLSVQNLSSAGLFPGNRSGSIGDLNGFGNLPEVKPPLPPRLYRPPEKPKRTFEHDVEVLEPAPTSNLPLCVPLCPISQIPNAAGIAHHEKNGVISSESTALPPKLPPKSQRLLEKMRPKVLQILPSTVQPTIRENKFPLKANQIIPAVRENGISSSAGIGKGQSPRGIQTNGSITPPKYAVPSGEKRTIPYRVYQNPPIDSDAVGNLGCLGELLNENTILRELEGNFSNGISWYNVGPVTLFLNPYNDVASNVTVSEVRRAPKPLVSLALELQSAFHDSDTSQSVIFSGEKGSGKTYLSMQLIRELFLAFGGISSLECEAFQTLSAAVTISRSLGRCRTQGNSNSSLIGFLYELHIADGLPIKSKLYCCFTDLVRIVNRKSRETNFHIFYEMLAGLTPEEKGKFHLNFRSVQDFAYLRDNCNGNGNNNRMNDNDLTSTNHERMKFLEWKNALDTLGIPFSDVMRLLAAVLLLGNVRFEDCEESAEVEIKGQKELEAVAALLGLSAISLYKALTCRTRWIKGHQTKTSSNAATANTARDGLTRTLYYRCVSAIIRRANCVRRSGSRSNNTSGISSSDGESSVHDSGIGLTPTSGRSRSMHGLEISQSSIQAGDGIIAVLDLFGFSNQEQNLFEDFCMNTVSEKLQRFYQNQIQRSQQVMLEEQVQLSGFDFEFRPRNDCLDLLLSPRGGVLFLLDDVCSNPHGSSTHFVQHLKQQQKSCKAVDFPDGGHNFVLHHYGGKPVSYCASDFVLTNRDELSSDLVRMFAKPNCNFGFASYLFTSDLRNLDNCTGKDNKAVQRIIPSCGADILTPTGQSLVSFSQDFAFQIDTFLKSLGSTRVRFIHCLKPNGQCEYRKFDSAIVRRQLQRLDILPTAQLLSAGLPYCVCLEEFNNRYRFLAARYQLESDSDVKSCEEAKVILDCYLKAVDDSNMPYISNQPKPIVDVNTGCATLVGRRHREDAIRRAISLHGVNTIKEQKGSGAPPIPPPRQYSVMNERKINFPQRRVMIDSYRDDRSGVDLRSGDVVTVIGNSNRSKHVVVAFGSGKTTNVPSSYTKLSVW